MKKPYSVLKICSQGGIWGGSLFPFEAHWKMGREFGSKETEGS